MNIILGIMCQYDQTYDLKINLGYLTYISWSSDFALYLEDFHICTSYFEIMNQYDPRFDLKINIGHCDLYFMVQ